MATLRNFFTIHTEVLALILTIIKFHFQKRKIFVICKNLNPTIPRAAVLANLNTTSGKLHIKCLSVSTPRASYSGKSFIFKMREKRYAKENIVIQTKITQSEVNWDVRDNIS